MSKIAVIMHDVRGGGAERMMLRLAGGFAEAGHDVDLVLIKKQGQYLSEIPLAVKVLDLNKRSVMAAIPTIARYVNENNPDIVLSALTHVNIATVISKFLWRKSPKLLLSERNQISIKASAAKGLRAVMTFKSVRYLYKYADWVVCVSEGVAADLAAFSGISAGKIITIYNPIPKDEIVRASQEAVNHKWFVPKLYPIVVGVGRLHIQKGFDALIKAHEIVQRTIPSKLIIMGEGEERGALQELIEERGLQNTVELSGYSSNPFAVMAKSDLFVLSSRWEGLPGSLLEALCCGVNVVSTDCPSGPSEILRGDMSTQLVPVDDVEALANAIVSTINGKKMNFAGVLDRFSYQTAVDQYMRLMR